jgi:catechol 2,3-dioxygenase-like lactoylglutathione lyase family enzyme
MPSFDHLSVPVSDWMRSRDWYVHNLGMKIEFEIPERRTVALQDDDGFTIFLEQRDGAVAPNGTALYFRVSAVETIHRVLSAAGVLIRHGPQRVFWGYGIELLDPDGYNVRLWDERSMMENDD